MIFLINAGNPMNPSQHRALNIMGIQTWEPRAKVTTDISTGNDLDALQQTVASCTLCVLAESRTQTVFGVGNRQAELMIIGEGPGFYEDQKGEPFVGRSGKLLDAMLAAIGFDRSQVYIANIVKCRTPQNRDPQPEEVAACTPYLNSQIAFIAPKLLLAVGKVAANYLLQSKSILRELRGNLHEYGPQKTPLIITYHPAYLLRNPKDKHQAYQDLAFVCQTLSTLTAK
jgi:uracil-DNA glycosylase family 4